MFLQKCLVGKLKRQVKEAVAVPSRAPSSDRLKGREYIGSFLEDIMSNLSLEKEQDLIYSGCCS